MQATQRFLYRYSGLLKTLLLVVVLGWLSFLAGYLTSGTFSSPSYYFPSMFPLEVSPLLEAVKSRWSAVPTGN